MADDGCFQNFVKFVAFWHHPIWFLSVHCVFGDFGQVAAFRPFPLWFLGFLRPKKPDGTKVTNISAAHSRNPAADGCDKQVEYIRFF